MSLFNQRTNYSPAPAAIQPSITMGSENEERPTKKRARQSTPSAEPSSKGKKQRGRPKVDTQDETAADVSNQEMRSFPRSLITKSSPCTSGDCCPQSPEFPTAPFRNPTRSSFHPAVSLFMHSRLHSQNIHHADALYGSPTNSGTASPHANPPCSESVPSAERDDHLLSAKAGRAAAVRH